MESAGSTVVDFYANRVTAPAHGLPQISLSAPLQLLTGIDRFRSRIQDHPRLEKHLTNLLEELGSQEKWQTVSEYPAHDFELQYLVRMDAIQFSKRTRK